jgi:hypothetical protein
VSEQTSSPIAKHIENGVTVTDLPGEWRITKDGHGTILIVPKMAEPVMTAPVLDGYRHGIAMRLILARALPGDVRYSPFLDMWVVRVMDYDTHRFDTQMEALVFIGQRFIQW